MGWLEDIKLIFTEKCVEPGTSFKDAGVRVSIEPEKQEDFVFCKIDKCLIEDEENQKADLFIGYSKTTDIKMIFVCELKGGDFKTAIKQIKKTLENERFIAILNVVPKNSKRIAIIAYRGGAPQGFLNKFRDSKIFQKNKFKPVTKTVTRKGFLDLRPIITKILK